MWRKRFENKIREFMKNLAQLETVRSEETGNTRQWERFERKYIRIKTLQVVIEG